MKWKEVLTIIASMAVLMLAQSSHLSARIGSLTERFDRHLEWHVSDSKCCPSVQESE